MDTYDLDGIYLWHHLPAGHGTRGTFIALTNVNCRSQKITPTFGLTIRFA
jgi:hypothetical protein